jgi:hypothetical protein
MTQKNLKTDDMFEKARKAFFETVKKTPETSASSAEPLKPENEPQSPSSQDES